MNNKAGTEQQTAFLTEKQLQTLLDMGGAEAILTAFYYGVEIGKGESKQRLKTGNS